MAGTPSYAYEQIYHAVLSLAAGSGGLRARLGAAYQPYLRDLQLQQLPWPAMQDKFDDLLELMVAAISPTAAVSNLFSDGDLREIAQNLVDLFTRVHEQYVLHQHGLG